MPHKIVIKLSDNDLENVAGGLAPRLCFSYGVGLVTGFDIRRIKRIAHNMGANLTIRQIYFASASIRFMEILYNQKAGDNFIRNYLDANFL